MSVKIREWESMGPGLEKEIWETFPFLENYNLWHFIFESIG